MNAPFFNQWPSLSAPIPNADARILSHGGGTQTICLAIMAARGDVGPMPDAAIFADTQWEKKAVYDYLEYIAPKLPFPIIRLTAGSLRQAVIDRRQPDGSEFQPVPFFQGNGMGKKQCSDHYKRAVVYQGIRDFLGLSKGQRSKYIVEQWIGFSCDELERVRDHDVKWIKNRWPLIEVGFKRHNCQRYLAERQYRRAPRSACRNCPFMKNDEWRDMRDNSPDEWEEACVFDETILNPRGEYSHRSKVTLRHAPIDQDDPRQEGFADFYCTDGCGV